MSASALRDYQAKAVDKTLEELAELPSVCLVAPTGAGKTRMGVELVRDFVARGLRVLWVAHRVELVEQAVAQLGIGCGVIVAGAPKFLGDMPCVVASLQTLARREMPECDVLVVDEAHHIMSASYQRLIERAGKVRLIGLTATPTRLDDKPLGNVFKTAVIAATVAELIDQGHLVKPRVFSTPVEPDLSGVKKTGGDFNGDDLEKRCNTPTLRGDIVRHWREKADGRPTVCFAASIDHSLALVDDFAAVGVRAVHVDGAMSKSAREAALQDIRFGRAKILSNVGIVTEGWDFPALEACILARPTASLSLLLQMVGRVMRTHPGKGDALVLDHAGNHMRHGVLPWSDIDWGERMQGKARKKLNGTRKCPQCYFINEPKSPECAGCGFKFADLEPKERKEIVIDSAFDLTEVLTEDMLLVHKYLARQKNPLKPFTQRLLTKLKNNTINDAFRPFIKRAGGNIGKAAWEFKQAHGRWPS